MAEVTIFAAESYSIFVPVIFVTVNVIVPMSSVDVEVITALPVPPVPVLALKPLFVNVPVKFPVTVALFTFTPAESFTFTVARDLYFAPDNTQVIVMLATCIFL